MIRDKDGHTVPTSVVDRLDRLERDFSAKQRPWYRRASDLFSLVAVIVAASSVVFSLLYQRQQIAGEERRQLSAVFNELGSVNAEMAKLVALPIGEHEREFASYALYNQLLTLVEEADDLAQRFEHELGPLELAVLGAHFAQVSDLDRATEYLERLTDDDLGPLHKASGYRSLGNVIVLKGKQHFAEARENYRKAIASLREMTSVAAGRELVSIHIMRARLSIAEHKLDDARSILGEAWSALRALPCTEDQAYWAAAIRRYAQMVQSPEPPPSEPCVFIDTPSEAISLDQQIGRFRAVDGTEYEISLDGTRLRIRSAGQVNDLVLIRDGMYEIKGLPHYFVLFRQYRNGKYQSITFYQPNGVFFAQRV